MVVQKFYILKVTKQKHNFPRYHVYKCLKEGELGYQIKNMILRLNK